MTCSSRSLKHATLERSSDGASLFIEKRLDAAGGVKQALQAFAKGRSDVRLMDERFMEIQQAMGCAKGKRAGAAYIRRFIEEMKATGFVADALKRSGQHDAAVAPAAK